MIYITVEGGVVQGVTSNDPAQIGTEVTIVDYDTDGVPDDELTPVLEDGACHAIVRSETIEATKIRIGGI